MEIAMKKRKLKFWYETKVGVSRVVKNLGSFPVDGT